MLLANDYSLLLGMPGTGKTSTITQLIRIFTAMGKTTLLSSFTNSAVDNVLLRLIDVGIDFVRVGTRQKVHSSIIPYTTEEIANNVNNIHELRHRYNNKVSQYKPTCIIIIGADSLSTHLNGDFSYNYVCCRDTIFRNLPK